LSQSSIDRYSSLYGTKKRTKEKPPSSLAFGSPREALFCGGGKNSSRFSVTQTIPAFIRSPALRSATLQRVLKPKITGMKVWFFDS